MVNKEEGLWVTPAAIDAQRPLELLVPENHLTPDDLAGMLKELRGIETGFDHINEVDNALNSVNNAISAITQQLNNPLLMVQRPSMTLSP